jgi:ornithine carbamoyltransferase
MGKESEAGDRVRILAPYQVNAAVLKQAKSNALVMHCLPAYLGKEITADVFQAHQKTIFDQAENRLHVQKAIMTLLAK